MISSEGRRPAQGGLRQYGEFPQPHGVTRPSSDGRLPRPRTSCLPSLARLAELQRDRAEADGNQLLLFTPFTSLLKGNKSAPTLFLAPTGILPHESARSSPAPPNEKIRTCTPPPPTAGTSYTTPSSSITHALELISRSSSPGAFSPHRPKQTVAGC